MFAERFIQALRAECAETSQSDVARRARVSQGTVNDFLNARRKPENMTLGTMEKLLPVLVRRLSKPDGALAVLEGMCHPCLGTGAIAELSSPYRARGSDALFHELGEVWERLPRSRRLRVLAEAHAQAEGVGSDQGGAASTSCDERAEKAG